MGNNIKRVGITGQAGFMGTHLFNFLGQKEEIERIPFEDSFFENSTKLSSFVKQCDVVVHLAAMNRHGDPNVIYETNIELVKKLINASEESNVKPHIVFSSSTQEERDNPYGKSKLEGRKLFENWADKNNSKFTGLIIPNVFGPFGHPYYNSVVATFCHQLSNGETPQIQVDGNLKLIYINELIEIFYQAINENIKREKQPNTVTNICSYMVPHTSEAKVSELLSILEEFKSQYFDEGIIPDINSNFKLNLFNTFRCFIPTEHFPVKYKLHTDDRGSFVEVIRSNTSGQNSFSTTRPGITRGNHYHTRKAERFSVIKGEALIQLRRIGTDQIIEYKLSGKEPAFVDMPIWHTHNLKNIGNEELVTLFWINEPYNLEDPDTFFEEV